MLTYADACCVLQAFNGYTPLDLGGMEAMNSFTQTFEEMEAAFETLAQDGSYLKEGVILTVLLYS